MMRQLVHQAYDAGQATHNQEHNGSDAPLVQNLNGGGGGAAPLV
jgi:hypothetical protein